MFGLLRFLGFKGLIVFFIALWIMPFFALFIAIKDRQPAWLLVAGAWLITMGFSGKWFTSPLDGGPFWILGSLAGVISWLVVISGAAITAKELTS